jgi:ammonium transporter, Amt family
MTALNGSDISWMMISTALVLFMTPALGFFYGGLVRAKNVLNTIMMSFLATGFIGILWCFFGYSLAFSNGNEFIGDSSMFFMHGVGLEAKDTIPHLLFFCFQGTFAIITAALISGSIVERMSFLAYLTFIGLWSLAVYAPVTHWVWGNGWLAKLGALDYAGGTVVHINAGAAALVIALVLGRRKDFGIRATLPHNVPFTILGTALLWLGWFGFNAGSALKADKMAVLAFANTFLAPFATSVAWVIMDYIRTRTITAVGAATGVVVGLVAITPGSGFVSPMSALAIGFISAFPSYFAIIWRSRTRLDDSLDVVAAHGLGGVVGAILTGVFAEKAWNGASDGLLFGNAGQMSAQAVAIVATAAYSAVVSFCLLKAIGAVMPLRVSRSAESQGLDRTEHGEDSYSDGEGALLLLEERLREEVK